MNPDLEAHTSWEDIQRFLDGNAEGAALVPDRKQAYQHIGRVLGRFSYGYQGKSEKGLVKRYLERTTGLSRAQLTRLVKRYLACGELTQGRRGEGRRFPSRYRPEDIELLAETDELHGRLSGPATLLLLRRAWVVFGDARFERLAALSNGHLYNLRRSRTYGQRLDAQQNTRQAQVRTPKPRRLQPGRRPGYLQVHSARQSDSDPIKGVYQIYLVDEVTQFKCVGSAELISELDLLPVLESLPEAFPFRILGLHAGKGSKFITRQVAQLLEKLRVEQCTKARPQRSDDNAPVESEKGTVIHQPPSCGHIAGQHAQQLHALNRDVLSPYLNYHRPCYFDCEQVDAKDQPRKAYRRKKVMTPYEKLKSLPGAEGFLRAGIDFAKLDALAFQHSDNEAARRLNQAREELFPVQRDEAPNGA